jgi:hypothetical protein
MGRRSQRSLADLRIDLIEILAQCCDLGADSLALGIFGPRPVDPRFESKPACRQLAVNGTPPFQQFGIQARRGDVQSLIVGHRARARLLGGFECALCQCFAGWRGRLRRQVLLSQH